MSGFQRGLQVGGHIGILKGEENKQMTVKELRTLLVAIPAEFDTEPVFVEETQPGFIAILKDNVGHYLQLAASSADVLEYGVEVVEQFHPAVGA